MVKVCVTVIIWVFVLRPSISIVFPEANNTFATTTDSDTTVPVTETGDVSFTVSETDLLIKNRTPNSIKIYWIPPKDAKRKCELLVRTSQYGSIDKTLYRLDFEKKSVNIEGLWPDTKYELNLTCHGSDGRTTSNVIRNVKTPGRTGASHFSSSTDTLTTDMTTDSTETKIDRDKGDAGTTESENQENKHVFEKSTNSANNAGKGSTVLALFSDDKSEKILVWLIPTIVASAIVLILIVAACSSFIVKSKRNALYTPSRNEICKKIIGNSEPGEKDGEQNTGANRLASEADTSVQHGNRFLMTSVDANTLQVRPAFLNAPDNRVALSVISWGSEFDALDKQETIYSNTSPIESPPPPYPAMAQQVHAANYRQNCLPHHSGSITSREGPPSSPTHNTLPSHGRYEQPAYAESNLQVVVPTRSNVQNASAGIYSNMARGTGINYCNIQGDDSIYSNVVIEERPPVIPPRS